MGLSLRQQYHMRKKIFARPFCKTPRSVRYLFVLQHLDLAHKILSQLLRRCPAMLAGQFFKTVNLQRKVENNALFEVP